VVVESHYHLVILFKNIFLVWPIVSCWVLLLHHLMSVLFNKVYHCRSDFLDINNHVALQSSSNNLLRCLVSVTSIATPPFLLPDVLSDVHSVFVLSTVFLECTHSNTLLINVLGPMRWPCPKTLF
jgi:hypothetical protein